MAKRDTLKLIESATTDRIGAINKRNAEQTEPIRAKVSDFLDAQTKKAVALLLKHGFYPVGLKVEQHAKKDLDHRRRCGSYGTSVYVPSEDCPVLVDCAKRIAAIDAEHIAARDRVVEESNAIKAAVCLGKSDDALAARVRAFVEGKTK